MTMSREARQPSSWSPETGRLWTMRCARRSAARRWQGGRAGHELAAGAGNLPTRLSAAGSCPRRATPSTTSTAWRAGMRAELFTTVPKSSRRLSSGSCHRLHGMMVRKSIRSFGREMSEAEPCQAVCLAWTVSWSLPPWRRPVAGARRCSACAARRSLPRRGGRQASLRVFPRRGRGRL